MRIAIYAGSDATTVDEVAGRVRTAADEGFASFWLPQTAGLDALTAPAVAAREVATIGLGTAVVPIQGRHPIPLAQQALTLADSAGDGASPSASRHAQACLRRLVWHRVQVGRRSGARRSCRALDGLLGPSRKPTSTASSERAYRNYDQVARPGLVVAALGPKISTLRAVIPTAP